jgi:hypothetical protein
LTRANPNLQAVKKAAIKKAIALNKQLANPALAAANKGKSDAKRARRKESGSTKAFK